MATAKKGASCLIMLNRNSSRAVQAEEDVKKQAAPNVTVHTVICDLQSFASVRQAADRVNQIAAQFGGLDVLAMNAGVMGMPDLRTSDGLDLMMQTNHLSHFLLTKLLMPSLNDAAKARGEVRIAVQSSLARGHNIISEGGGDVEDKYYLKSAAGTLGGNTSGSRERYHQSKMANALFALALHSKFARSQTYSAFKAIVAAPGFAKTHLNIPDWVDNDWIKSLVALSAPDGSCSLLIAMFEPSVKSGDFYEPKELSTGPPKKVVAEGVALPRTILQVFAGIKDAELCDEARQSKMWNATETGIGEKFVVDSGPSGPPLALV
jgi:NAD(P)-dependent dehydrogenase (short-subunit alcohol dehydrogenase family)